MSDSDIKEKIIQVVPLENAVIRLLTKAHLAFLEGEHTPTTNGNSADWQKISPSYYEDTHPRNHFSLDQFGIVGRRILQFQNGVLY